MTTTQWLFIMPARVKILCIYFKCSPPCSKHAAFTYLTAFPLLSCSTFLYPPTTGLPVYSIIFPPLAFPQTALKWCNIHGAGGGAALISLRYFQPDNGHLKLNGSAVTSYNAFWSQYQKALCISLQIRRQTPAVWFQHTRASSPSLAPSAFTSTWTVL